VPTLHDRADVLERLTDAVRVCGKVLGAHMLTKSAPRVMSYRRPACPGERQPPTETKQAGLGEWHVWARRYWPMHIRTRLRRPRRMSATLHINIPRAIAGITLQVQKALFVVD